MQVIFVWLVICSPSSSLIRVIDDTLLGRSTELRIYVFGNAGHVFPSCSYLCRKVYQPLFWLVCGLFALKSYTLSWSYKFDAGLCGCVAFHYMFRISELNMCLFLVSRNIRSMWLKSIVTDATLTLCVLGDLDSVHVKRWRVRLFSFSTTRVLIYSRFFITRVWRCMTILSPNWCLDVQLNVLYSVGVQEINNTHGMHFDQHCSCYSFSYQLIPYLASYGQPFSLWTGLIAFY